MSQLQLSMASTSKEDSCLRPYFDITNKRFKTNGSTFEAWCWGCLNRRIEELIADDRRALEDNEMEVVRTRAQVDELARASMQNMPISSSLDTLTTHARTCGLCIPEVDRASTLARRQLQRNSESLRRGARVLGNLTNIVSVQPPGTLTATPYPYIIPLVHTALSAYPASTSALPASSSDGLPPPAVPLRRTSTLPDVPTAGIDMQQEFVSDLCRLFVALNLAWNAIAHPETKMFFAKWLPKLRLPDRRILAGPLLNAEKQKAIARIRSKVCDQYVTLQCDGWVNIARTPVITSMISLGTESYLLRSHNMFGAPKTGEHLFEVMQGDDTHDRALYGYIPIAVCTDNGPDGKKMRRLACEAVAAMIAIVCWAHQNQLIIGDLINRVPELKSLIEQAVAVAKWFLHHGVALSLLHDSQARDPDVTTPVNPLLPAATRWGANYFTVCRLLRLEGAIRWVSLNKKPALLAIKSRSDDEEGSTKAEDILQVVNNSAFWSALEVTKLSMEPLAISSLVLQRAGLRLDEVLLTLANLFRIYSEEHVKPAIRTAVHESLERRWKAADQEVFILAVLFNPFVRTRAFSDARLTRSELANICRRMYTRFNDKPISTAFWAACQQYFDGEEPFADDNFMLDFHQEAATSSGNDVDLISVWRGVQSTHARGPEAMAAQELVQLAKRILSVVAASTACERNFSSFGIIHSKLRNRLDVQSTHDINVVRMDINSRHADAGNLPNRLKRKHGDANTSSTSSATSSSTSASTSSAAPLAGSTGRDLDSQDDGLDAAARALRAWDGPDVLSGEAIAFDRANAEDSDDDNLPPAPGPLPAPPRRILAYKKIPLAEVFLYPAADTTESRDCPLLVFWRGAVKKLEADEAVHQAAQQGL